MSYARPFGQQQAASPWSAGVPPGFQQQPPPPPAQAQAPAPQMFSQPMGPFDLSAAWQVQPQQAQAPPQVAAGQWAQQQMQQVQAPMQFVPNSGPYMQPMQMHHQHQQRGYQQQQQQQRVPHHQRSLSAPRIGGGQNNKRAVNQNNSFGGGYQRQQNNNSINSNNNNNNNQAQRVTRQQGRQVNQKVQFSNNNNNYNNNANNNKGNINNNTKQQNQNQKQQQQPQQQQQQQQQQQAKGPVKVTKAAKKQALANANRGPVKNTNKANNSNDAGDQGTKDATPAAVGQQEPKPQSKTAERKQLKLQARKNAEALQKGSLPVVKSTKSVGEKQADAKDEPSIDQNQLKCVPAVFGFVCKLCDVFLRDRASRREHVDLEEHMQKFKVFEEEQQKLASLKAEEAKSEVVEDSNQVTSEKPDESTGEEVGLEPTVDADATSKEDAAVVTVE